VVTSEPLQVIAKDNSIAFVIYAKENDILDTDGWKQFKLIAKQQNKFTRLLNQAKLRSYNNAANFKSSYEIPRAYDQAMKVDEMNGNTKWQDAINIAVRKIN
jgi:hypothetical protein